MQCLVKIMSNEEVDLQIEASEANETGRSPEQVSSFYAKGALQFLVPVLMQILTKQEDFDDEDDWSPCKVSPLFHDFIYGFDEKFSQSILKKTLQSLPNKCPILLQRNFSFF